jgi:hypothetical protein
VFDSVTTKAGSQPADGPRLGVVADSASQRLAREVTKKARDTGLVLWLDADRGYSTFVDVRRKVALAAATAAHELGRDPSCYTSA